MSDLVTSVLSAYRKNRINHRLRFGNPVSIVRLGWHRSLAIFMPGDVFGYIRWSANKYGTQDWQLFICEAQSTDRLTRIPGVLPGAKLLLHTSGTARTKKCLKAIDALEIHHETLGNVSLSYWQYLHNQMEIGWKPRPIPNAIHTNIGRNLC